MCEEISMKGFGLIPTKQEGKPIHPDHLNWECWCEKCQNNYKKQLETYNQEYKVLEE